jgi:hypothetical protein
MKSKTIKIWTKAYLPWRLGGDGRGAISTIVKYQKVVKLGHGYQGVVVKAPDGSTVVAERETGAIIGSSVRMVHEDVSSGNKKVMKDQMAWARKELQNAQPVTEEKFWTMLKKWS